MSNGSGELPVFWNGQLVPASLARPEAGSPGFLYGESLFETLLARGGGVLALGAHLDRLLGGAERLHWRLPWGRAELAAAVRATVAAVWAAVEPQAGQAVPLRVRLTVACAADWTLEAPPARFDLLVTAVPYHPDPTAAERGWRAATAAFRLDPAHPLAGLKAGNYWPYRLARAQARAAGADEALLLTIDGRVAEGSVSNVFAFVGGRLLTPPLSCGILPGVTRAMVLQLAPRLGWPAAEEDLDPGQWPQVEEAFLTNSLMGLVPLVQVDGQPIGSGRPGRRTRALAAALAQALVPE